MEQVRGALAATLGDGGDGSNSKSGTLGGSGASVCAPVPLDALGAALERAAAALRHCATRAAGTQAAQRAPATAATAELRSALAQCAETDAGADRAAFVAAAQRLTRAAVRACAELASLQAHASYVDARDLTFFVALLLFILFFL